MAVVLPFVGSKEHRNRNLGPDHTASIVILPTVHVELCDANDALPSDCTASSAADQQLSPDPTG